MTLLKDMPKPTESIQKLLDNYIERTAERQASNALASNENLNKILAGVTRQMGEAVGTGHVKVEDIESVITYISSIAVAQLVAEVLWYRGKAGFFIEQEPDESWSEGLETTKPS